MLVVPSYILNLFTVQVVEVVLLLASKKKGSDMISQIIDKTELEFRIKLSVFLTLMLFLEETIVPDELIRTISWFKPLDN
jgi:hypothetical protein